MWSLYVTQNNNQLDQVELKDLFKKALVLLDQSSKVAARLTEKIRRSISIDLTNLNRVPGQKNAGQKLVRKIQKTGVVLVA